MRAVIEVRKDADEKKLLGYLFKYSDLQMTFGINMVAIAEGKPQQLGLKALITPLYPPSGECGYAPHKLRA